MYILNFTGRFKKDFKLCVKRNMNIALFEKVAMILENEGTLPSAYKPHPLRGIYTGIMECHISPDWLLLYRVKTDENEIDLIRMGTHADLF